MDKQDSRIDALTSTLSMISRLSIFNSVNISEYNETEDEDSESEEEDKQPTCVNPNDEYQETDKTVDQIIEEDEIEEEDDNSASESDPEYFKPDINEYYKKHANQFDDDPCFQSPLLQCNLETLSLNQLNIQTNQSISLDNQKSPRSQLYEVADELDKVKKENEDLLVLCNNLKITKCKNEESIQSLSNENSQMRKELDRVNQLVDELKSSNSTNKSAEQIEKLRAENQSIYLKLAEENEKYADLENQMKKLKKYEFMFKKINLIQINSKVYQLARRIGKGGFSEVYHCISNDDYRSYALKKCDLKDMDEENTKLVLNEIELLKKLQATDRVVKLFEHQYQPQKKMLYVLMEMGSCDLSYIFKREINQYKTVREPARVMYWKKMLEAVQAIHKLGVIHSDLKPANFLLVNDEVKLIDFNISIGMGDRTSITCQNECGTMEYMSPDIFLKDEKTGRLNQKVDVWALGVILYLMTYGFLPLQHIKNQMKKIHSITDPLMKEFKFGPIENENLLGTLHNCLRHDPNDRYTVTELLNDSYITRFK